LWPVFVIAIGLYFVLDKSVHPTTAFFGTDLRKTGRRRRADSIDNSEIYGLHEDVEIGVTEPPTRADPVALSQPPILHQPRARYGGCYLQAKDRATFGRGPNRTAPRAISINVASLADAKTHSIYRPAQTGRPSGSTVPPYTPRSRANSTGNPAGDFSAQELWKAMYKSTGRRSMLTRSSSESNLALLLEPAGEASGDTKPHCASKPNSTDGPTQVSRARAWSGGSRYMPIHDLSTQIENRPWVPTPLRRCDVAESSEQVDEGEGGSA